jgi:tRNA modification GTPase
VQNKSDLPAAIQLPETLRESASISISTANGEGLDRLKAIIADSFLHGKAVDSREAVFISNVRHRDVLLKVMHIITGLQQALPVTPSEFLAADLREALQLLGQISGETTPDDILDLIFSQFCVGK